MAVSKNHPIESVEEAIKHGVRIFGENRVQEAKNKFENLFNKYVLRRSQDLPDLFCPTGAIWVSNINKLKKYKSFYSPNYMPFIMDLFSAIDIDTVIDLKLANIFSRELNINER